MFKKNQEYKMKVNATHAICWSGLCVLVAAGVPIAAILGTSSPVLAGFLIGMILVMQLVALTMVWCSPADWIQQRRESIEVSELELERDELRRQIAELDERLKNVETIDRVDRLLKEPVR